MGYVIKDFSEICDLYIINTCAVTAESSRKSYQMIRRAQKLNPNATVTVTGCQAKLDRNIKGVTYLDKSDFEPMAIRKFNRTRAYIKIEDGCNSKCSYCIIPTVRGRVRCKPIDNVIDEAKVLIANGCKEIVLIGIETSAYKNLPELIHKLDVIDGIERIRLGSLDPSYMRQMVADEILSANKICPHFHLSVQSGSNKILRAMRRKYTVEIAIRNIEYIRKIRPEMNFTTDIMVGFPGESIDDFNETIAFLHTVKFLHAHIFTYSKRPGTEAADMSNQIPESEKNRRAAVLAKIQDDIKKGIYENINPEVPLFVLFETFENRIATGHTPNFLEISIASEKDIRGKILEVKINEKM